MTDATDLEPGVTYIVLVDGTSGSTYTAATIPMRPERGVMDHTANVVGALRDVADTLDAQARAASAANGSGA